MTAAISGNAETVTELLTHGANVNATEREHNQTALMFAAAENRAAVVSVLATHGANVKATTKVVQLDEQKLDDNGNPIPKKETEAGSTVTGGNTMMGGMTALLFASRDGHLDAVRALLEAGADVNQISAGDHSSPLVIAIANSHYEVGKFLVDRGADPNLANVDGLTPLYATIDMQYAPVSWAPNPLTVQEKISHVELIKALLAHGADPNAKLARKLWFRPTSHNQQWISTVGTTAFWRAAQGTDVPAMRALVAGGADPKIPSAAGTTALMVAAGLGYAGNFSQQMAESWIPAVQFCLDLGLDVNARRRPGLHRAARRGVSRRQRPREVSREQRREDRRAKQARLVRYGYGERAKPAEQRPAGASGDCRAPLGDGRSSAHRGRRRDDSGKRPEGRAGAYGASGAKVSPEIAGYATWMKAVAAANTSLKKSVEEKQAAAISLDAQTLADVFGQVQEYWTKSNTADAAALSKTAHDASLDLAAAAKAGNWEQAGVAMKAIGGTCSGCHTAHREKLPDGAYTIKK